MHSFTAIVEKCSDTHLFVGYIPGIEGAHSQGVTLEELRENLEEVLLMIMEERKEPIPIQHFIGLQQISISV